MNLFPRTTREACGKEKVEGKAIDEEGPSLIVMRWLKGYRGSDFEVWQGKT